MKRLRVRLLSPPEDVSWGIKYIATALGKKGYQIVEPHTGEIVKDVGDFPAHSVAWSEKYLAVGSDNSIVLIDKYLKERDRYEVPSATNVLIWDKDEVIYAGGDGWIVKIVQGETKFENKLGVNVTSLFVRGPRLYVGSKEGLLIVLDKDDLRRLNVVDLGSPIVGIGWLGGLVVATMSGYLYQLSSTDITKTKVIEKFNGISAFANNPKGDEIAVAERDSNSIIFIDQYLNILKRIKMGHLITAMTYSRTSIEVAVVMENGELITLATPKVDKLIEELLKESMCESAGEVICLALERALWKFIGALAPDINLDEFHALKQLGPRMVDAIACFEKHIEELRQALKSIVSLEDVVEVVKGGCERLEKWLDTIAKNAECIMQLSEEMDYLLDIASSDILPTQLPTSIALVEQFGCEKAKSLVECIIETYKMLRDMSSVTEELGIALPPPGEIILYMVIKGECEEMKGMLARLAELRTAASVAANEGKIDEVLRIKKEASELAEKIKNMVESALPEGYVGS